VALLASLITSFFGGAGRILASAEAHIVLRTRNAKAVLVTHRPRDLSMPSAPDPDWAFLRL